MKKRYLALAILLVMAAFALTACGGGDTPKATDAPKATETPKATEAPAADLDFTFDLNYEGAPAATVQKVKSSDVAEEPAKPARENYEFTGWYTTKDCAKKFDFEEAIYDATTVYAGWKQTAVVVTFDANYEGGEKTAQTVAIGETASQPVAPEREGFLFTAWYADSACTEAYDFASAVTDSKTLFAGWEEDSGD